MIKLTILGECVSMKNSRELVQFPRFSRKLGKKVPMPAFIKSEVAREYEENALKQIPPEAKQMLQGRVRMTLRMYYRTSAKDMDEHLLLDILQSKFATVEDGYEKRGDGEYRKLSKRKCIRRGVYVNDNQVWERHTYRVYDPHNPRVEIELEEMEADMFAGEAAA